MADKNVPASVGAAAVADAVKRVADAAVKEVEKTHAGDPPELVASGVSGGRVIVQGSGFGPSGTVKLNGVQVPTISWSTTEIVGRLPADAKSGELVVEVDDKTTKRGRIVL